MQTFNCFILKGFSLEGAGGYAAGLGVAWPLPGTHIPNQFLAQIVGVGVKLEMAAFVNHCIHLGYLDSDLGFMTAAPSIKLAEFSGNPTLYYRKFSWAQLDKYLCL